MAAFPDNDDQIRLSPFEIRVLLALSLRPLRSYDIGRQCELDLKVRVSHGTLYPALKRLEALSLISREETSGVTLFKLSHFGRLLLQTEIDGLRHLVKLADERRSTGREHS